MRIPRLGRGSAVAALCAVLLSVPVVAARAEVGGDGNDPAGYKVSVSVQFTGTAFGNNGGGGGVTKSVSIHPSCYWAPADGPYTNAAAMFDWYMSVTGGVQSRGNVEEYGPQDAWQTAKDEQAAGHPVSWYKAYCDDPADYPKFGVPSVQDVDPIPGDPPNWVVFLFKTFPAGQDPPPPLVAPAQLAQAAYDEMGNQIPAPQLDRNPHIKGSDSTLVGLQTWFWVTNPKSVGYNRGNLTVRATVGAVWAQVRARVGHLTISTTSGDGTTCTDAGAQVPYVDGAQSSPCTVTFSHSGDIGVAASTLWNATWTGSDGAGPNGLPQLARATDFDVPVSEVQNIVVR